MTFKSESVKSYKPVYCVYLLLFTSRSTQTIRCAKDCDIFLLWGRLDIKPSASTEVHGLKREKLWSVNTGGGALTRCDDTQTRVRTLNAETHAELHMCARILPSSKRKCRKYQRGATVKEGQRHTLRRELHGNNRMRALVQRPVRACAAIFMCDDGNF